MKLQNFHFKKSRYDRPSAKKSCGLKAEGGGCELGPNQDGLCPGRAQCVPYRSGDRWDCTRSQSNGGKCKNGPGPDGQCPHRVRCVPVDSVRYSRRKLIAYAAFLLIAIVLTSIYSSLGEGFISPGELSAKHGGVALNQCADCHGEATEQPQAWFARALNGFSGQHSSNNNNCLSCHKLGAAAGLPHSIPTHTLQAFAAQSIPDYAAQASAQPMQRDIPCFSCHQEHQGKHANLTEVSNRQCDSCHQQQHESFKMHPEFRSFSPAEKTEVAFDHQKHFVNYFLKDDMRAQAKTQCDSCHTLSEGGRQMAVKSFGESCKGCHQKDVTGEKLYPPAVAVLGLPLLDVKTLADAGVRVGSWPAFAEARLTPFMFHWLSQYPEIAPVLNKVRNGDIDLSFLEGSSIQDLQLIGQMVWRIKQLFLTVSSNGPQQLLVLSEKIARADISDADGAAMFGSLSVSLMNGINGSWFKNISRELANFEKGNSGATVSFESDSSALPGPSKLGGWYAKDFNLYYQPSGHADPFMLSWLTFSGQYSHSAPGLAAVFSELSARGTPGQCGKCHESLSESPRQIRWTMNSGALSSTNPTMRPQSSLNNFDHARHLHIVSQDGCASCHQLDMENTVKQFSSITKADCQSCHTAAAAGDDCTTCHSYHLNPSQVVLPTTAVSRFRLAAPQ
ncbi:MAG: hypothetical protein ACI9G5_000458 [Paracoccaceae bacterium]|jgi:hypothetical protein